MIQTSSSKTYMKVTNLNVVVTSPKPVTSYSVVLSTKKVGDITNAFSIVGLSAPFLSGSYVQLVTTAGFDLSTCSVPAPSTLKSTPSSTQVQINANLVDGSNLIQVTNVPNRVA